MPTAIAANKYQIFGRRYSHNRDQSNFMPLSDVILYPANLDFLASQNTLFVEINICTSAPPAMVTPMVVTLENKHFSGLGLLQTFLMKVCFT